MENKSCVGLLQLDEAVQKIGLKKKTFLFVAMFFYVISASGQIERIRKIDSLSFIQEKDTLDLLYGQNKKIPEDYKLCFLIAISHYPELTESKIVFKNAKIKTTLNTRPTILSTIFRDELKRKYIIRVNNSKKPNKVLINQADFNSKVGLIGHELGHVLDYSHASAFGVMKRGFSYLTKKSKKEYENKIDLLTIQKGLGWQLHDWSHFVLHNSGATDKYKKFKQEIYLSHEQIYDHLILNDYSYVFGDDGKRDTDFLFKYCYKLRDAYKLNPLYINEYLNTQPINELSREKNIKFLYEFAIHAFKINTPFNSSVFNYILNNRDKFYQYFDKDQVDTRIVWIIYASINEAIEKQDEVLFNQCIEALKPFDTGQTYRFKEIDGRTTGIITSNHLVLSSQMEYYLSAGNMDQYNDLLTQYLEKIWNNHFALNTFAWDSNLRFDDPSQLEIATECVKRSIELSNNYNNNDTYSWLLYKLGNYDKALTHAEKAIEIAKQNNLEYEETSDLIVKLKSIQNR
jgi:tetratricopeptide (TPR) repeat protein